MSHCLCIFVKVVRQCGSLPLCDRLSLLAFITQQWWPVWQKAKYSGWVKIEEKVTVGKIHELAQFVVYRSSSSSSNVHWGVNMKQEPNGSSCDLFVWNMKVYLSQIVNRICKYETGMVAVELGARWQPDVAVPWRNPAFLFLLQPATTFLLTFCLQIQQPLQIQSVWQLIIICKNPVFPERVGYKTVYKHENQ